MQIKSIKKISFTSNNSQTANFQNLFDNIPELDKNYTTPESKANTVSMFGSSKTTDSILKSMEDASAVTREVILNKNMVDTGCGSNGMMGVFYNTAAFYSKKENGKPVQNLAIVMTPPCGGENIQDCILIGKATSESDRIEKFAQTSDNFLVQKGSVTTLQEVTSLIGQEKNIMLADRKFYSGLNDVYQKMFQERLINFAPEEAFAMFDNKNIKEILDRINFGIKFNSKSLTLGAAPAIKEFSDCFVVYKGGLETLKQVVKLIQKHDYQAINTKVKPILCVNEVFKGLQNQYQAIAEAGLLKHKPSDLFKIISVQEAKKFGRII